MELSTQQKSCKPTYARRFKLDGAQCLHQRVGRERNMIDQTSGKLFLCYMKAY